MESKRFDAIARAIGKPASRRRLLRGGGLATLAGAFGLGRPRAAHGACRYIGCACVTGTRHACIAGHVCCPINPGLAGGVGTCQLAGDCALPPCTGLGCPCTTGTFSPCDAGLICVADSPGLAGGPGTCQQELPICVFSGNPCFSDFDCCSGACIDGQVCY